jgi:hypothetical protein
MASSPLPFLIAEEGRGDGQAREALFCSRGTDLGPLLGRAAATGARVTVVPDERAACVMVVVGPTRALVAIGADGLSPDGWRLDNGLWTVATADRAACPALVADVVDWLRSVESRGGLGPLTADGVASTAELLEELAMEADIVDTGHRLVLSDMRVTGPGSGRAAAAVAASSAATAGAGAVGGASPSPSGAGAVGGAASSGAAAEAVADAIAGSGAAALAVDEAADAALEAAVDALAIDHPEWGAHRHGGRLLHVRSGNRGTFLQAAQALEAVTGDTDAAVWSTGPTSVWAIAVRSGGALFHVESDARSQLLWRHYRLGPLATPTALARNPELATRSRVNHGPFRNPFPEAITALVATGADLTNGAPTDCTD